MFCTTFLSAPSEDLGYEGTGGTPLHLGPGSCLSTLHCLVLPQDELYTSLSEQAGRVSVHSDERTCGLVSNMLFDVGATTCSTQDSRCIWDRVRGRRSRSASPSRSKIPQSPCRHRMNGMCCSEGPNSSCDGNRGDFRGILLIYFHVLVVGYVWSTCCSKSGCLTSQRVVISHGGYVWDQGLI